nr:phage protease [uncultured Neokomagataea sp.]
MTYLHFHTALPESNDVPEWIHLLPAGVFRGIDQRGPYTVANADQVIAHSMQAGKLVLDENHATDKAALKGGSAPAVGWIVEMQSREDGIWGRVDWTKTGRALMSDKAYRGVSPAFAAQGAQVTRIARASLTNLPNLTLTHLHTQEIGMDPSDIARRLGLPITSTQSEIETALERARDALSLHTQAVTLAGLKGSPSVEAIVTGLRARTETVETHAQQQITALQEQVKDLGQQAARHAAEQAVKDASTEGRIITDKMRERLVHLHMQDPEAAEEIISGLPKMGGKIETHTRKPGAGSVDGHDAFIAAQLGVSVEAMQKMRGAV